MARLITPWSVKGIDNETRELARQKAKNSGINIGAWINRAILSHGSREYSGATDLHNVVGDSIPKKLDSQQSFDERSNDIISQRLQQLNKNLDGELRPIMFALNNLALRLAAAEALQKKEPKKINKTAPVAVKPKLEEDVRTEIIDEDLGTEELINEQPTPSLERPDPFPPAGDLNEEIDVPKMRRQKSNMELENVPISESKQSNGKGFSVKAFLVLFSLIVFPAVASAFYFFPQTTNKIARQITAATEHHLDAVSQTLNDSLLYSQRLLELFLGKSAGVVETDKRSKINRDSRGNKEGLKKTESKPGNQTPPSVYSRLVLPNVENPVSNNILTLNDKKQNKPINNPLHEEKTQKKTLKLLRSKANNGDALAQYKLGLYWIKKEKNYLKAATWFKLAAVQDLKEAQYSLGILYDTGFGLKKDENQAFLWYHAAANNQHPMAQFNVGNFYLERENGKGNFESALRWFELASKNGVDEAAHNFSILSIVDKSSKLKKSDILNLYTKEPAKQLNKLSRDSVPYRLNDGVETQKVQLIQKGTGKK